MKCAGLPMSCISQLGLTEKVWRFPGPKFGNAHNLRIGACSLKTLDKNGDTQI